MKNSLKLSLVLNLMLVAAVGYLYSGKQENYKVAMDAKSSTCDTICMHYTQPFEYMNGKLLSEMAAKYQDSRCRIDNPDSSKKDAVSVWFGLDAVKRFIYEIEKRACNRCGDKELGIRIYYARYPELPVSSGPYANDLAGLGAEYTSQHTVFMIPSYRDPSNSAIIDYDITNPTCSEQLKPQDDVAVLFPRGKNHGTLCPPICEGYSAFCSSCNEPQ